MKTWRGWESHGNGRSGARASISTSMAPRSLQLEAQGLIYPSFESRGEIARLVAERERSGPWPRDPDGAPLFPGNASSCSAVERRRRRERGEPYALRLDVAAAMARAGPLAWIETGAGPGGETGTVAAAPQMWGDVVLARKEMPTSYHLAVVVDDARQGITQVVRGRDLFSATSIHRLLAGTARAARRRCTITTG